jgi:hypothetical protein
LPWAETGRPTIETWELLRSTALPAMVMTGRWLAGDEAVGEAGREHLSGVSNSFWGTGRKGAHRSAPPQRRGSGEGRRRRERHPAVDGGGSSAGEGWGISGDLVVVPVRLEEGRSGWLPAASLPQLDRASACSPSGRQLTLLMEEEVAGAARWPDSEALRRRPSDGDPGVEERHDNASGRAGLDRWSVQS